jgi:hypothetical protein
MRFLHGTPWVYNMPDPGAANSTYFGSARYGTAGQTVSDLANDVADAERVLGWDVPTTHRVLDGTGGARVADPNLELTTARYAGDVLDYDGHHTYNGAGLAPNVRGEFYDVRNPLDFEQQITFEDAERLIQKIMGSDPATTSAIRHISRRFQGRDLTVGDALEAIEKQIGSRARGGVGSAADAAYSSGFDGIVSRASTVTGTPGGQGAVQWAIPSTNQIIPAGNIPDALVALERRGIIEAEPWKRLFDAATSKDPIRLMQELLFLEGR